MSLSPDTLDRLNRVIWPALERSWGLPYQASAAAAALMSRYLRLFRGSLPLALAAYNAGEGTVRRFLTQTAQGGAGQLPRETRDYVTNVVPRVYD